MLFHNLTCPCEYLQTNIKCRLQLGVGQTQEKLGKEETISMLKESQAIKVSFRFTISYSQSANEDKSKKKKDKAADATLLFEGNIMLASEKEEATDVSIAYSYNYEVLDKTIDKKMPFIKISLSIVNENDFVWNDQSATVGFVDNVRTTQYLNYVITHTLTNDYIDYDTSGLPLFSSEGDLTQRLLHPKYNVEKEYVAKLARKNSEMEEIHVAEWHFACVFGAN